MAEQLAAFDGDEEPAAALQAAQALIEHVLRRPLVNQPILKNDVALHEYLRATMGACRTECIRIMFLDGRWHLIRDEVLWTGTIDGAPLYVREVAKRALDLGAAALVVMHNHPSGSATPSKQDVELTRELMVGLKTLGVQLCDHLIVTRSGVASLRNLGFL